MQRETVQRERLRTFSWHVSSDHTGPSQLKHKKSVQKGNAQTLKVSRNFKVKHAPKSILAINATPK